MRFMVLTKWLRILRKSLKRIRFFLVCPNNILLKFIDSNAFIEFSLIFIPIIEFITIHFDSICCIPPSVTDIVPKIDSAQKIKILFVEFNMIHFNDTALGRNFSNGSYFMIISSSKNLNHFSLNLIRFIL